MERSMQSMTTPPKCWKTQCLSECFVDSLLQTSQSKTLASLVYFRMLDGLPSLATARLDELNNAAE
eukprot:2852519-Amphidinium_carterae.1